ncbi:30S ribosomal protein S12 methylthiotransferase RimO [Thermatribacter velox]|uniref:Ribosomal protein uS12 methylthiotransferase RimO n=1 Tax=Thermatribacter velox TaxID=3039681 RepID=A0ABZ2YAU8_9BACT
MKKVALVSLGCDKNLVDSEVILGKLLTREPCALVSPEEAEVVILNTCAFIEEACQESEAWIRKIVGLKKKHRAKKIVVAGCYVQRFRDSVVSLYPEVDLWVGVNDFPDLPYLLDRVLPKKVVADSPFYLYDHTTERVISGPPYLGFLKIAEGCNNRCSFCVIPAIRGPLRSRSIDSIVREVENFLEMGVKEIILIAQDTASYGVDLYGKRALPDLLKTLDQLLSSEHWLRVLYFSPQGLSEEFLEVFANSKRVVKYLDIPLQHVDPDILVKMNRPAHIEKTFYFLRTMRKSIPQLFLRTTFMVGFPGESESSFQKILLAMEELSFERAGVFAYSEQEGTPASRLFPKVPASLKTQRLKAVRKKQEEIMRKRHRALVGSTVEVIVEKGPLWENNGSSRMLYYLGRSYGDAPDVDCEVKIQTRNKHLKPGTICTMKVTAGKTYLLEGVL